VKLFLNSRPAAQNLRKFRTRASFVSAKDFLPSGRANSNRTGSVRIFEMAQESCKTIGERPGKIILRREHSPDRCSDCTIVGVGLVWRDIGLATHAVLRTWV
jgi:hypothetical protein